MGYQIAIDAMHNMLPAETLHETGLILSGSVGSTLTGLTHEASDVDRMLFYAYSPDATMRSMVAENNTKEAFFNSDPDVFGYEAVKVTSLLMKSNPPMLNFLHSSNFETMTDVGEEIVRLTKAELLTLDALKRVIPASAMASAKESEHFAYSANSDITDSTLVKDTPKNVARKLKVAFILLQQAKQALHSNFYKARVDNREWFLEEYPAMKYAVALEAFQTEFAYVKNFDVSKLSFKEKYTDDDVRAMRDWVVRAKKSVLE